VQMMMVSLVDVWSDFEEHKCKQVGRLFEFRMINHILHKLTILERVDNLNGSNL